MRPPPISTVYAALARFLVVSRFDAALLRVPIGNASRKAGYQNKIEGRPKRALECFRETLIQKLKREHAANMPVGVYAIERYLKITHLHRQNPQMPCMAMVMNLPIVCGRPKAADVAPMNQVPNRKFHT